MNDYLVFAFRNLKRRGIRSWLTLLGVFIGIAVVVSLIMLGNTLRVTAAAQFGITSTQVISVQAGGLNAFGPPGSFVAKPLQRSDVEAIKRLPGVEFAIPRNIETVKVDFNDFQIFGHAVSLPRGEEREFLYELLDLEIEEGDFMEKREVGKVLIGSDFSDKEKSGFDKAVEVGDKLEIAGKNFIVKGILVKKGSFILDDIILVDDEELKDISDYGDDVDIIGVKVKDKDSIEIVKEDIEELMRDRRNVKRGEEDFEVSTPQATLETIDQVLLGVQIFVVLIALISIAVGSIGIVNTMTTSVLERKNEIGIMKAIGAKNSDIFLLFFFEAGLLGLIGGIIGVLFGLFLGIFGTIAINNFIGSTTKPQIDFFLITFSLIGSFVIGSVSGIVPALRAANQNPVDALRG